MSRETFRGTVPDGLLYDVAYEMWVRRDGETVTIGATSFGIHMAGEIIAFTSKPNGADVARGRGLGTLECSKTALAVHAPVSIAGLEGNEAAEQCPALLNSDPYANWMVRGLATAWAEEAAELIDATTYKRHVLAMEPQAILE
jgi:glycine cleavage system H protein